MEQLTQETAQEIERLLSLTEYNHQSIADCQNIINRLIDNTCSICFTCGAQVRFAFQKLKAWYEVKKDTVQLVDIKLCKCGNVLKDKRYKKCDKCK